MNNRIVNFLCIALLLMACKSTKHVHEDSHNQAEPDPTQFTSFVSLSIEIEASSTKIWEVITQPQYAKVLGAEFDKNAFIDSDWKLGSKVHFMYEPDRIAATGIISKLVENELIQIDFDFDGFGYQEKFTLAQKGEAVSLSIHAGPYGEDNVAQHEVWNNWLRKVKELSESEQ